MERRTTNDERPASNLQRPTSVQRFTFNVQRSNAGLLVCSAFLYYLSFPNIFSLQGFPFCAWIFAIPFFSVLEKKGMAHRIVAGFFFGFIANLAAVNWMIPYSIPGYLFLSLVLSSQAIVFAMLYRPPGKNHFLNLLYISSAWVSSEFVRRILMMGESWDLGHTQSFNIYFIQIANVLGSSGISFVLILVNYCFYYSLRHCESQRSNLKTVNLFGIAASLKPLLAMTILVFMIYSYGFLSIAFSQKKNSRVFKICTLQPNIDYHGEPDLQRIEKIADDVITLTRKAAKETRPDLIIWPETTIPTDFLQEESLKKKISAIVQETGVPFLIGAAIDDEEGTHNSAVLLDKEQNVSQIYHKRHLIPLSEYIPSGSFWKQLAKVFHVESFEFAPGKTTGIMNAGSRFAVGICSEDNIAALFRNYFRQGAEFVVVLLNNSWFSQESGLVMHGQHSVMRAVENSLPVVRVANTGWSVLIDRFGRVTKDSLNAFNQKKFFYYEVPLARSRTIYNIIGDTFCYLCLGFVIMNFLLTRFKKEKI